MRASGCAIQWRQELAILLRAFALFPNSFDKFQINGDSEAPSLHANTLSNILITALKTVTLASSGQ